MLGAPSQIQSSDAVNFKALSRATSKSQIKSRVNSAFKSSENIESTFEKPFTKTKSPLSRGPELTSGQKMQNNNKNSKIRDKLKTRQDLLFIRLLQESGATIFSDPEIKLNLLYDWERDEYFQKMKKKVEVKKKKGPRELLNP